MSATETRAIETIHGLSPLQRGMLFHTLYEGDSGAYLQQVTAVLAGELEADEFRAAWLAVMERHPVLRSAVVWEKLDQPVLVVQRTVELPLRWLDWSDADDRDARFAALLEEDRRAGFELTRAPLMRLVVIREGAGRHRLLWSYHHLLLDGWSLALVLKELFACFEGVRTGRAPVLGATRPYRDYIAWLKRQDADAATAFWRAQLAGFREPTSLGVDYDRDLQNQGASYRELRGTLSRQTTRALQEMAQRGQLTLSILVQGAWALLLARYGGSDDVVFGTTVSGRPADLPGVERMVGLFINTLPTRVRVAPGAPVAEWLRGLLREQAETRQYEYSALSEIQALGETGPGVPLFDTIVVFENYPIDAATDLAGGPLKVEGLRYVEQTHYPLTVLAVPGEELALGLAYDTRRFDEATVRRMLGHLRRILEEFAAAPERPVGGVAMLSAEERALAILPQRHAEAVECAHQIFERHAERRPTAAAVISGGVECTYQEVNREANRLAHRLIGLGVRRDDRVGICLDRSPRMVIALLGVMKSGAAYVPMDPADPAERLRAVMDAARPAAVVVDAESRGALEEIADAPLVELGDLEWESDRNPAREVDADDLAYVLYTSGSTGTPKGVMVPHRSLVSYTLAMIEELALVEGDRVLEFAPLTFDASVVQIFPALLGGAALCIQRDVARLSNLELLRLCEEARISVLDLPAAFWQQWVDDLAAQGVKLRRPLRFFLTGGESTFRDKLRAWAAVAPPASGFLTSYGPTEATVAATVFTTDSDAAGDLPWDRLPLGRPLRHAGVYLLDPALRPVPPGVTGYLHLGGEGVSRGYLGDPRQTARRFIPDPFSGRPGARMFATGDLARLLADGTMEFRGREDVQVKVRGFRIELAEIETALARHPDLRGAVVTVHERAGGKELVAYVVADAGAHPDAAAVRAFLGERLPAYMVPAFVVPLTQLPATRNGKIDRDALPAPRIASAESGAAPLTEIERVLAEIWAGVLEVERVGRHDDFFALGGHSLSATQLVSRIRAWFQVELPLASLFEHPTPAGIAAQVEAALGRGAAAPEPILATEGDTAPLSLSQQRLWFLDQLNPGEGVYNLPVLLRLTGRLDAAVLERAFHALVQRHESLRTTFVQEGGEPVQKVHPAAPVELPLVDLGGFADREARAEGLAREEGRLPFDLAAGPLFRARLVRLADDEHLLLITMHHIVSDGWSMGILIREVAALYQALAAGTDAALAPLPVHPRDFARWQRAGVAAGRLQESAEYWKEKLADPPGALALPTDRRRPARQSFAGARERRVLSPELTRALGELSRKERATLFMVILSAFKLLLFRYSGQADLVVGSPVANRTQQSTEGLIGFFLNTLALRTRVSGAWSFRKLLESVRETTIGAYTHQDLPFEQLLEMLQPGRELSATPLFQVMFNMQNFAESRVEVPGLAMESVEPREDWSKFDLTLFAEESGGRLRLDLVYGTELFDAGTVRQMLEQLERVLRTVVENPAVGLSDLALLAPGAPPRPRAEPFAAADVEGTVDALFRRHAGAHPERLAVSDGARTWSYGRLDREANRLAHVMAAGSGPIALLLPHGAPQAAGMLAALRCGRMYVPLDPAYPVRRLEHMLRDSGAGTILAAPAQRELAAGLAGGALEVIGFDPDAEAPPTPAFASPATPSSHAYILYTSGSTGEPKGAVQSQRNLLHHIRCYTNNLELAPADRLLQVASYSFDAAVMDIFGALLNGASLFPYDIRERGVAELGAYLRAERITIYHSTPTVYRYFLDAGAPGEALPDVRRVVLGGEEVVPRDVERFQERFADGCVFINGFGPTESTLTLQYPVAKGAAPSGTRVPIGHPVQETAVVLLDADGGEIADVGVGGLAIRSRYLVLGYWNSPERNAAVFTADPADPELRTYRTGDIGRRRFDGAFEYLGRADAQVKVRGFRVEVAEVEAVLAEHPGVRECVVVAAPDARGETRLVAYAVPRGELPAEAELRRHLAERLPDYMVPAHFVEMEAFPLTPTGKVHRLALPAPPERERTVAERRAPRDAVEEIVAATWCEVLRVEDVAADDDFFALGGHSLLATQVVSRLQQHFAVEIPLRRLFEAPTVAGLAEAVRRARGTDGAAPRIGRVTRRTGLPLSFAQQRLWFMDQVDPGNPAYVMPAAVELNGPLDTDALRRAIGEVVRRHEVLRMTFADGADGPVQTPAPVLEIALPVEDLSGAPDPRETALRLALEDAGTPFDLARGPLLRARLLRLGPDRHLLLLAMHHIVCDGWSMGVLVSELAGAYGAFSRGLASPLPELPIQYADFAHWQRGYLTGEVLESHLGFWRSHLGDQPPVLTLAGREPAVRTNRGERLSFQVPDEVAAALKRITREHGATLYMTLLAAYQTLIMRLTGQEDFVVGTAIANRNRREVEPLIGFFVNMLPLRSDLGGQPRFTEVLRRARAVTLDAYAHQEVPFEKLVKELAPRRSLDRNPLFQVFFGMLDMPEPGYELGGLSLNRLDLEYGFARFDLSLFMAERAGKLEGTWLYSPDLYDEGRIGAMAESFQRLLAAVAEAPERLVAQMDLFPARPARSGAADKLRAARLRRAE